MTANEAENTIMSVEGEIDNLQILLKISLRTIENLDKNDIYGILEMAQHQGSVIKAKANLVSIHLTQLRQEATCENHPHTH